MNGKILQKCRIRRYFRQSLFLLQNGLENSGRFTEIFTYCIAHVRDVTRFRMETLVRKSVSHGYVVRIVRFLAVKYTEYHIQNMSSEMPQMYDYYRT